MIVAGLIGARAAYVIVFGSEMESWWDVIAIWKGGLILYGGILAAVPMGILYASRKGIPVWTLADAVAPACALGFGIGRLGCFLYGCCWGPVCDADAWYAVRFPQESAVHRDMVQRGLLSPDAPHTPALVPSQLVFAVADLGLCLALLVRSVGRRYEGQVFVWFLGGYSLLRFGEEFLRADVPRYAIGGMGATLAQWTCVLVWAASCILAIRLRRRDREA